MNKLEFTQWICEKLSAILQFEVQNDMAEYIISMQTDKDLDEYCRSLLDIKSPVHKQFLLDLKKRHKLFNQKPPSSVLNTYPKQNMKIQDKEKETEIVVKQKKNESKSKNKKYVNIYSSDGINCQEMLLQGRHKCNCQATKHDLINNCLSCGRIVCKQEGSGPCVVCGELVCSNDEKHLLNCNNNKSKVLYTKLIQQTVITENADHKALEHRNKLLEFDRTSAKRTTVIDDQMDYYSVNSGWLSSKQREQLQKKEEERQEKKHGLRKTKKIVIDFAGRQVYEDKDMESDDNDNIDPIYDTEETHQIEINEHLNNPLIKMNLKFNDNAIKKIKRHEVNTNNKLALNNPRFNRVQDAELMLMADPGLCLSMHQPYASLLLLNIKSHEGRSWFTQHRGRLWIASTAKRPTQEDITRVEAFYKNLKGDIEFPKQYPIGCLLGCVNIVDCLSQEEYIEQYPQGENESPFIFICKDPVMMANHFPIKGQHKIFKLDEKIHNAAQKFLMKEIS